MGKISLFPEKYIMKTDELYQHLKELAEKLDITVSERNLKTPGIHVKSGLCTVKGKKLFIMDKLETTRSKADILAACLSDMPVEDIYIVPAIRNVLDKYKKS